MSQIKKTNADENELNEKNAVLSNESPDEDQVPVADTENISSNSLEKIHEPKINDDNVSLTEQKEEFFEEIQNSSSEPQTNDISSPETREEAFKGAKEHFESLLADLNKVQEPEQKLQKVIEFMESTLAQKGTPHFKSFWEARNLCIELFRQNLPPAIKQSLWNKYSDLSKEARRLREILDEQSAFAAEQIEIAIQAMEAEIANPPSVTGEMALEAPFSQSKALANKLSFYLTCQHDLNFLNAQASRITALRKELIRTNMRIRTKNKFFQRLSTAGDLVFPKRKDLIKEVSQSFIDDVEAFIVNNFSTEVKGESLFYLREEIKALQSIAKVLTLNTHAFTHTRLRLSECWDKVKSEEKDRKKARIQQKVVFKQNYDEIHTIIQITSESFASNSLTLNEMKSKIDEIVARMRQIELGHDELKALRQEISDLRKAVDDKIHNEERTRLSHEEEKERQRRKNYDDVFNEIADLINRVDEFDIEFLLNQRVNLLNKITEANLTKKEKQDLEKKLKTVQDLISDKKEKAIMSLSDDDRQAFIQLKELLKEKKERRREIKNNIELLRKSKGSSGLDFEKALQSNIQLETEKANLEKVNASIEEIEEKIEGL